jgi:hypothetical protein
VLCRRGELDLAGRRVFVATEDQPFGLAAPLLCQEAAAERIARVGGDPAIGPDLLTDHQALAENRLGHGQPTGSIVGP